MSVKEKIYFCEVKKLFMRNGEKRWEWVTMAVADAGTKWLSLDARIAGVR